MPAAKETLVDRDDLVLVIVDIQERLAAAMKKKEAVVGTAKRLAKAAALVDAPVIVTRQYPKGLGGTVPELEDALMELAREGARVSGVDKMAFCCAAETEFVEALAATGRKQVVIVGMETHICVTQTALALAGRGYQVQVPADGCTSIDPENHETALHRLRTSGVVVTTSESVMYEAVGLAGTDEFKQLLGIVKS